MTMWLGGSRSCARSRTSLRRRLSQGLSTSLFGSPSTQPSVALLSLFRTTLTRFSGHRNSTCQIICDKMKIKRKILRNRNAHDWIERGFLEHKDLKPLIILPLYIVMYELELLVSFFSSLPIMRSNLIYTLFFGKFSDLRCRMSRPSLEAPKRLCHCTP